MDSVSRPPITLVAIGTYSVNVLRCLTDLFGRDAGGVPPHLALLGIDTTAQQRVDAPMLPPERFVNLAEVAQAQQRLSRAREDAAVARWMHPAITRMAVGRGAGGQPQVARFLLEQSLPQLIQKLSAILDGYRPAARAQLAERAASNPSMRSRAMTVSLREPIEIILLISTAGGTAGIHVYVAALLRHLLAQRGLQAHLTLLVTPPALAGSTDLEARRRLRRTFARFQELADLAETRRFSWATPDGVITNAPGYAVCVLPEPTWGKLEEHQRRTANLLFQLIGPLGKDIFDRFIDVHDLLRSRGPLGQKQFVTLLGWSQLRATAVGEPKELAEALLGSRATRDNPSDAQVAAAKLLEETNLTVQSLDFGDVRAETPRVPRGLQDPKAFLDTAERTARAEAERKANQAKTTLTQIISDAASRIEQSLAEAAQQQGPAAAARLAEAVADRVERLAREATGRRHRLTNQTFQPRSDSLVDQLEVIVRTQTARARADCYRFAAQQVDSIAEAARTRQTEHDRWARVAETINRDYQTQLRRIDYRRSADHAILDRRALEQLAAQLAPECDQEVRAQLLEAARSDLDAAAVQDAVRQIVDRHAGQLAKLKSITEAWRAGRERAPQAVENAAAAATSTARVDPPWDSRRHCVRYAFITVDENHPANEPFQRDAREVRNVPAGAENDRITMVTLDCGIEIGALEVTREAQQAYMTVEAQIAPFADQNYRPQTDLVVPPRHLWFALLAIPLHLHLGTEVVSWHSLEGFLYKGCLLGRTRQEAQAIMTLADEGRPGFLPPLEELAAQTKKVLLGGRTSVQVLEILEELEEKLSRHLHLAAEEDTKLDAGERLALMQERSAVRALLAEYRERTQRVQIHMAVWGGDGRPDPRRANRLSTSEPDQPPSSG